MRTSFLSEEEKEAIADMERYTRPLFQRASARPPYDVTLESIPTLEGVVVSKLPKILLEKAAEGHG